MKKILIIALLFGATNLFAQTQSDSLLIEQIPAIQIAIEQQQQKIKNLNTTFNDQQNRIIKRIDTIEDSLIIIEHLKQQLESHSIRIDRQLTTIKQHKNSITQLSKKNEVLRKSNDSLFKLIEGNIRKTISVENDLGNRIQQTEQHAKIKYTELGGDIEKTRLYWIIATLATFLLGVLMYLFLGKRIKSSKSDVETQIRNTRKSLEEEGLKLDSELVKVFQKQLEVIENTPKGVTQDEDHSLVLKIADRLTAMETNLYRMDTKTPGVNTLKTLIRSTKVNFNAKEYEIVEMLGNDYKEGMEVIATFIPSDEIEIGKQIITRIIKPQVNFKGHKIQAAQIEVTIGE